jgi:flavin reductase (DIM6/NTAB) family NADH-FMN oxidoreductase RutF
MSLRSLPLGEVYRLLEPGPVVLVSTARAGRANVMAMSWHTMMEFEPPLVGCVLSARNHTYDALMATRECVIAIPTVELAAKVVGCGNTSGRKVDKFARFDLTALPAARVRAPLIAECYANLECRLADASLARKYNFLVLRVVKAWIDPARKRPRTLHHMGRGLFMVAGRTLRLPSRAK